MSIFSRFRALINPRRVSGVELMTSDTRGVYAWSGSVYRSDIVRACTRPAVSAVGKLTPKHIIETTRDDGGRDIRVNPSNSIRFLLEEPNQYMTMQAMLEKLASQLMLNGNAFAVIQRDDYGNAIAIYPIAATSVDAAYTPAGALYLTFTLTNGKRFSFDYDDVIHIRRDYHDNELFGSPIAPALAPLLDVVTTTDQGIINAIKNGGAIRWLLKFKSVLPPSDMKRQTDEFARTWLSTANTSGVAGVNSMADAQQVSTHDYVPNADVIDRTTARIYALFGVSPDIVSNKANEAQTTAYFDAQIEPIERQLSAEFTRKLFSRRERAFGNRIVFEASAWDSASLNTKLALSAMVDRGALTPNEWRRAFNLAPVPGGDEPIRRLDTAAVTGTDTESADTDARRITASADDLTFPDANIKPKEVAPNE
ncbi:phage portal protein [Galactobacillus timonensis]|uniref:phage portal protein n=1 Tax=Galactobacillus timonensis TaxID=2041840 RepID=UPI000C827C37|nr:phage portal protein [Galactobacillus timonensis]